MNGPLKMYKMTPIVNHSFVVELPQCMYRLQNIHADQAPTLEVSSATTGKKVDILDQNNKDSPEMAQLEAKQDEILKQLAELKKQIDSIRHNLNLAAKPEKISATFVPVANTKSQEIQDFVIHASPTNPPYSLEILQKLWRSYVALSVKSYTHSTLPSLSDEAKALVQKLETFTHDSKLPRVHVRLIWKEVGPNMELIVSQRPICGEVNLLRYLSRLSSPLLNYETYTNVYEIDALLDASYGIINAKTKTERGNFIKKLNKSLGKNQWLAGQNQLGIADLGAYSALKQTAGPEEINVTLTSWMKRCSSY